MNYSPAVLKTVPLILIFLVVFMGCRRVTIVSNSIVAGGCAEAVESKLNNNNGESWVYTKHLWPGSTAYNNPINHEIYSSGVASAFGVPDTLVMSFSTNDMGAVTQGVISFESAVQSMQTLINQGVAAGANCVVLLEASHSFWGDPSTNPAFAMNMDEWFNHWHDLIGDNEFLGIPYRFLIADISAQVHADPSRYLSDYIHLSPAGAELAAEAILDQVNLCPEGRWVYGENMLKPNAKYPENPYLSY